MILGIPTSILLYFIYDLKKTIKIKLNTFLVLSILVHFIFSFFGY